MSARARNRSAVGPLAGAGATNVARWPHENAKIYVRQGCIAFF